jgi:preprotein translocase subunit SecE
MKAETKSANNTSVVIAVAIFIASLAIFYLNPLNLEVLLYKVLILLLGSVIAILVFLSSAKGAEFKNFITQTKIELKKVIWPTKDHTLKTTGIVLVAVIIVAIFLWLVDAFWTWIV